MEKPTDDPVGIEAFEDGDATPETTPRPQNEPSADHKTAPEKDQQKAKDKGKDPEGKPGFFTRHATKINLVLVVALAIAITIIIQQQGANRGMQMPEGHPDISQGAMDMGDQAPGLNSAEVEKLQKQMSANPQDPKPAKELGKLYFDEGFYADATTNFRQAAKLDPRDIETQMMLGTSLYGMSDYDGAKAAWEKATEIDPTKAEPWYNLGFVYLMSDPPDYENNARVWGKAKELAPDSDMAAEITRQLDNIAAQNTLQGTAGTPEAPGQTDANNSPASKPTPGD